MNTKKLKQLVLDLAIHGKLVPQDPNDEPASELLKRIQADVETHGRASNKSKGKKSAVSSVDLEVPFEVPEGWCWCYSGEIAYIASGSTPSKECFVEEGIPYLKMYNLRNQKIDFEYHPQYITPEIHNGKLARSRTEVGDIIMNIVGPPLGKLAIIPAYLEEANFNQAAVLIRPLIEKDIIAKYLFYYLSEMSEINSIVTKGTAGQENISLTQSQHLRIPLPPLAEQHRIVAAIEKWFAVIDQLEKNEADLKKSIEQTKKKVLDLAIRGKLVAQNPEDEPAGKSIKAINPKAEILFESDEYGEVPEGWCLTPLIEVCSFESGYAYDSNLYQSNGVPLVRISNINNGVVTTDDCVCIEDDPSRKNIYIENGDVLIAMSGATTGKMGVYKSKERAILNQRVGCVRVKSNIILKEYRNMFLQSQSDLILKLAYGGAQPNISGKMISSLLVPLPPIAEQKRIVEKIEEVMGVLERIEGMM